MYKFAAALLASFASAEVMHMNEFEFMKYISVHNKSYGTREEYNARLANFIRSDDYIKMVNAPSSGSTHRAGHNKFSDWSEAEFTAIMKETSEAYENESKTEQVTDSVKAGSIVDWRD